MQTKTLRLKRALRAALIFLLLGTAGVTMAQSFTVGDLRYSVNNDGVSVTLNGHVDGPAATGTGSLIIPEIVSYEGSDYSVTTIGSTAFFNCLGFSSITCFAETPPIIVIDYSLSPEGIYAFYGWSSNTPIYVPCGFEEVYASSSWTMVGFYNYVGMCEGSVTLVSIAEEYGTVSGGGLFETGQICTIRAVANDGYTFTNWTHNGRLVSLDAEYTFYVAGDMIFEAHFVPNSNIVFADAYVKSICVTNWDTNGDGELSYGEAAAVTCLGDVFWNNSTITSFDELQFFTGLTLINSNTFNGCSGLSSITFPNTNGIGVLAFLGCSGLSSITIPSSMDSFGADVFAGCSMLSSLYYTGNIEQWCRISFYSGSTPLDQAHNLYIDNALVTNLVIPDEIRVIKNYAFSGASCLNSLTLPNSLSFIGYSAFSGCSGISCITVLSPLPPTLKNNSFVFNGVDKSIPVYVPSGSVAAYQAAEGWSEFTNIQELGNNPAPINFADANVKALCVANWDTNGDGELSYAEAAAVTDLGDVFTNNSTITSFDELQYFTGLTAIGDEAFFGCCDLTSMEIPSSVTVIGNRAFYGCDGLTSIEIPNSVASIGDEAFSSCSWVVQIVVDVNNTVYDSRNNCNAIIKTSNNELIAGCQNTEIPNSVTSIGNNAFDGCFYMTSIEIPNSVTSIGNVAFNGCSGLTSIEIPNSVTFIGHWAFGYCTGLTLIEIPHSVTSIGISAFSDCSGLEQIVVDVNNTVYDSRNNCNAIINKNTNELVNGCKNTEIPNSVTSIGSYAFSSCYGLTSMEIPNSVTSIECGAFYDCWGLTSIEIPNSVTSIGEQAFYYCIGLTSIEIPNSVTSIGNDAFNGCIGLTSIEIPNSVTSIGNNAFNGCRGLTSIEIPNSVTSIGSLAFGSCNSLTTIRVDAVTPPSLNWGVFNGSTCPIYVPYESINAYKTSWTDYASRIQPWMQKSVIGYGSGNDKWVFISSPFAENTAPSATAIEGLMATTATDYDLFRFNQESNGAEWQNYKAHTADFMLENGKGYLYANKENVNVVFMGTFNEETSQDVELDYIAGKPFAGWNLVGNPFPYAATVDRSYYVMNAEGTGLNPTAASSGTSIEACTGIMVKAETTGESVTFAKPSRKTTENNGLLHITVANEDKAIVSFNEGDELSKYYFGEQNANIYIPKNGKEYAIVSVGAGRDGVHTVSTNEIPVNFKATENGSYTLTVDMENVELDYLHLIDNMTGADIDLLQTPEYTFSAKTTDYESRFRLLFDANENGASTGPATFAYYADGEIRLVVETQDFASLQIVDVMGRVCREMLASPNHRISTAGMTPGMYVLRLIEDDNVKTQKIVVQ